MDYSFLCSKLFSSDSFDTESSIGVQLRIISVLVEVFFVFSITISLSTDKLGCLQYQ